MVYDDGDTSDENMAQERFQFCPPLQELDQMQAHQSKAAMVASAMAAMQLADNSKGGSMVTSTAFKHQADQDDDTSAPQHEHADSEPAQQNAAVTTTSCSQPQHFLSDHCEIPRPDVLTKAVPAASSRAVAQPAGGSAEYVTSDGTPALPAEGKKPDTAAAGSKADDTPQASCHEQVRDDYEYAVSQAEGTPDDQHLHVVSADAQTASSTAQRTGRKRLPVRPADATKRQKQLASAELKAARGPVAAKQPTRRLRQTSRLAKAASQKLAEKGDDPRDAVTAAVDDPQLGLSHKSGYESSLQDQQMQQQQREPPAPKLEPQDHQAVAQAQPQMLEQQQHPQQAMLQLQEPTADHLAAKTCGADHATELQQQVTYQVRLLRHIGGWGLAHVADVNGLVCCVK